MANMTSTFSVSRLVDKDAENHACNALHQYPGIQDVKCDHSSNTIVITYDSATISSVDVEDAVTRLGIMVDVRKDQANI